MRIGPVLRYAAAMARQPETAAVSPSQHAAFERLRHLFVKYETGPLSADEPIEDFFDSYGWVDRDDPFHPIPVLHEALTAILGLSASLDEMIEFLNAREVREGRATFVRCDRSAGEFAEWLLQRSRFPPMGAANICGKDCKAAGVFLGLTEIARELRPDADRIAPSTPLLDIVSIEDLVVFWERTHLSAGRSVPNLRSGAFVGCSSFAVSLVAAAVVGLRGSPIIAVLLAVCGYGGMWLVEWRASARRESDPENRILPKGVRTFGDLARAIAASPA